ncbi:HEPN domain-containing protein [Chryseobacterium pennipullorum]|nr:HEPN domain-containing protein [Chryseobacterium pennipullorum]
MKNYYCINLKFRDQRISDKIHHAHLFISDEEMYFQIIDDSINSRIDLYYSLSENALGLFEESFEIVDTEVSLIFDKSRVYKSISFQSDGKNRFFTIFLSNVCIIKDNIHKEFINEGIAYLNRNGLKVVNLFYSFFTNLGNKNLFSISRMKGMSDYYKIDNLSYRPELEFTDNERRSSEEFTVKKMGTINFRFEEIEFEEIRYRLQIICNCLSFFYGIRVIIDKLVFRTENYIYIFRNMEPTNQTYVSDMESVSEFLNKNYRIEKFLKNDWYSNYIKNEKKITKAIDNILHAREVNPASAFLLLFNIIEIFNINQKQEKFSFNTDKKIISENLFDTLKLYLNNKEDEAEFEKKLKGAIDKLEFKPFKSPLEETLKLSNIDSSAFGFNFGTLKKTRDSITHGSLKSIKEDDLQSQVYCLRKIAISLILSNLGFKDELNNNI